MALAPHDLHDFSLSAWLAAQAHRSPHANAILAPDRTPMTYSQLWQCLQETRQTLRTLGVGRQDRVAVVLPDGPEVAVASLALAASATCAPLNLAYRDNEYEFYFADLDIAALIVQSGVASPARTVAQARGIPLIELTPVRESEAGRFTLQGNIPSTPAPQEDMHVDDVALILYTSGTTSRPKIVPLTQRNLMMSAHNIVQTLALDAQDRCLNIMPLFHIHGLVGAILSSLVAGASVVCTSGFHPLHFFTWLTECRPTWYTAVPTMHQGILARAAQQTEGIARSPLRFIRSCSASLPPPVMAELERTFGVPVIEAYGMTEAAHQIASNPPPPAKRKIGSVGLAAGLEVAIMDETGCVLAPGETAEVVIRGANVTLGYANNSAANASAYCHGWFRTGDQGFLDSEGYLFLTGRLKELINRGGEKIAPREVEDVLLTHPAVAQAVAFAMPHPQLGEDVAAAVVLRPGAAATATELRAFAATRLADFKVPRQVFCRDEIPKSATGKLRRIGLAETLGLTASAPPLSTPPACIATRTPLEGTLVEIYSQVLGVTALGLHDNFFQLGGDSILATQILSRIRQILQLELSFLVFFEHPTVADMASHIATVRQATEASPPRPTPSVPRDDALALSSAQQRLWFFDQLEPGSPAYNRPVALHLRGPLNVVALEHSLNAVVQRHEILRTTFPSVDGRPIQLIAPQQPMELAVNDLQALPEPVRTAEAQRLMRAASQQKFDLAHGPLLHPTLLRFGHMEHILLLVMHHIVFDGWSVGVLWRDLAALYDAYCAGKPAQLSQLPLQYADFAHWQQQWLHGPRLDAQLCAWQQHLGANLPVLALPTDHPRPAVPTFRGARHTLVLPQTLSVALKALSQREQVTLFMTLLAAFQTLLSRYTGQEDIVVGSPVAGRHWVDTEALIGLFVNTLVLRTDLSGNPTFREVLRRVRAVALHAYTHQELPFERLVEALQPERDLSRNPLFQVMFQLRNLSPVATEVQGLRAEEHEFDRGTAVLDLAVDVSDHPHGLCCMFEYNTDLFEAATIARFGEHFQTLLAGIVANPHQPIAQLPLLTEAEQRQVLVTWNASQAEYSTDTCIHTLFEAQAARTPEAIAVVYEDQALTYDMLNRRANQVAQYLRRLGVGPEVLVGLCVERSLEMLVGLLGILKAGGAYVPLDPAYPTERLACMVEDSRLSIVLTQQRLRPLLSGHQVRLIALDADWDVLAGESTDNLCSGVTTNHLVYVIYTSGSTGIPKGVMIEHQSLVNYIEAASAIFAIEPGDRLLQFVSLNFDPAAQEIFTCLTRGATLVLRTEGMLDSISVFVQKCQEWGVTILSLPTAYWHELVATLDVPSLTLPAAVRLMIIGGEQAQQEHLQQWDKLVGRAVRLINAYGPTETTIAATMCVLSEREKGETTRRIIPIGRAVRNVQTYVLDQQLQPVPIGVPGELYIGGRGLARGYLNRPELTAAKFISNPFSPDPTARLYKTGDLVRFLPNGNLEFLGRLDTQVKVRGFRIELGEIETELHRHPAVHHAMVLAQAQEAGQTRLIAYVVPNSSVRPPVSALRHTIQQALPAYMVPAAIVWLDALPLLPNGKVDRRALPGPDTMPLDPDSPFEPPRTAVEAAVADIWKAVLGLQQLGIYDNFFALGGHSLLATQVSSRLRSVLQVTFPLQQFFATPTVAGLAQAVITHEATPGRTEKIARMLQRVTAMSPEDVRRALQQKSRARG